jgi:CheY-like chemotaxis protein
LSKSIAKKANIIVVDDDDDIRDILQETFTKLGYQVMVAENGLKLIAILRSEPIDAVLLDINMPWLSGLQICRSIKKDKRLSHIKVIYVTGTTTEDSVCWESGCDGLIRKPFEIPLLVQEVEKILLAPSSNQSPS